MTHRCLVHCFEAWVSHVDDQRALLASTKVADAHWKKCTLLSSFLKWWKLVRFVKTANMSLLNGKYRSVLLHSAFSGWFMLCRKTVGDGNIAQRYHSIGLARSKFACFKQWVVYTTFRKRKAALSRTLISRYASLLARKGFEAWRAHIDLLNKKRKNVQSFIYGREGQA